MSSPIYRSYRRIFPCQSPISPMCARDKRSPNTPDGRAFEGKVAVVNATITPETRSGLVIARFDNPDFALRPGGLLNAEIALEQTPVKL